MIGLGSTFIIMACSIYLIVEGFDVFSNTKYKKYRKYGEKYTNSRDLTK